MITGKIDLTQLKHIVKEMNGQNGATKVVILPIDANHLYVGKNGNIYLDLVAFENASQFGDTHIVKQSLPKTIFEAMTPEQKKAQPILGNMKVGSGTGAAAVPQQQMSPDLNLADDDGEDLPF